MLRKPPRRASSRSGARARYRSGPTTSLERWARQVVRNKAIDMRRRAAAISRPPLASGEVDVGKIVDPRSERPLDSLLRGDEGELVRSSLRELPSAQAEVIVLAYFGGMSCPEIAARLGCPEGTVKGRMRLGLQKLRWQLRAFPRDSRPEGAGRKPQSGRPTRRSGTQSSARAPLDSLGLGSRRLRGTDGGK